MLELNARFGSLGAPVRPDSVSDETCLTIQTAFLYSLTRSLAIVRSESPTSHLPFRRKFPSSAVANPPSHSPARTRAASLTLPAPPFPVQATCWLAAGGSGASEFCWLLFIACPSLHKTAQLCPQNFSRLPRRASSPRRVPARRLKSFSRSATSCRPKFGALNLAGP